ncbi:MAG: PilZ domain-containing protein, partial [Candidatus Sulfotelmatobacter sp.]
MPHLLAQESSTVAIRWDEKAGLRTGCSVRFQVIDVLKAQIKRRPAMKKVSIATMKQSRNISHQKLTIGLDLGDRNSSHCVLDEAGQIPQEPRVRTNAKGLRVRGIPSNKHTVTFAVMNGKRSTQEAFGMGANFVLHKPLSGLNTSRCFNAAISFILREHRRYFRHPLNMPVTITANDKEVKATATNLSENEIALQVDQALPKNMTPRLQFTLPDTSSAFDIESEVAWADLKGRAGLRFRKLSESSEQIL